MPGHRTLAELLTIENDPAILEHRCPDTGLLTWPLLRNQFLRALASAMYYPGTQVIAPPAPGRYRRALAALPKTLWANGQRWSAMRGDILVMASGAGHFQRDGGSFNRITDYFALESIDDTVTVEGLMDWRVPPNPCNHRTYYFLPWQGRIDVLGKLRQRPRHAKAARELLEYARARAADTGLQMAEGQATYLASMVATKIARLPAMLKTYRRLLGKVRPRLVLLEQGCYSDLGVFNLVARDLGIRVAEPQHGLISAGHDAYSYAPVLRESAEYRRYLPHDFLGYGDWWNRQINVPLTKWVVGHPHYIERLGSVARVSGDKRDILFLSDGFEFEKYVTLAAELKSRIGDRYRVLVRPHPLERARVRSRYGSEVSGLLIDRQDDIYPSLAAASAVVGELSTGLFEAIGLADRTFIWATPKAMFSCPAHPFASFSECAELAELVLRPAHRLPSVEVESVWASGWQHNYRHYLEHALNGSTAERVNA